LYWDHTVRIEGKDEPTSSDAAASAWTRVTPGFFETLGDRIVLGEAIADTHTETTRPVAVINEAFAKKFFGNENPIGRHFGLVPASSAPTYEIIGVASDIRYFSNMRDPIAPMYFLPEAQGTRFDDRDLQSREVWSHYPYSIVIWAPGAPSDLEQSVRKALAEVDANLVMYGMGPYDAVIRGRFVQEHMIASLASLFGAIGLMLAAVGLYGVTAYGVQQRTSEIGVRMALGADRASVLGLVLRGAFGQVSVGLVLGIPAAIAAGHLMGSRLYGVRPWDWQVLGVATLLLASAAGVAALGPARHAANLSPMRALRD
jgi:putative ABC transport system permease protein